MGYQPDQRTLRDIAFTGDHRFFIYVARKWTIDPVNLDVCRHAGASGRINMISHVVDCIPQHAQQEDVRDCRRELLTGLVQYDRDSDFVIWLMLLTRNDERFILDLVTIGIRAGARNVLAIMLDRVHSEQLELTQQRIARWFSAAVRAGRAHILDALFRRFAGRLSADTRNITARNAFPARTMDVHLDDIFIDWMANWNPDHFRPVDHMAVFRFMCEDMALTNITDAVLTSAITQNRTDAIRYMHATHLRTVQSWTDAHWTLALTQFDNTDLATAAHQLAHGLTLSPNLLRDTLRTINTRYNYSDTHVAKYGVQVFSWLISRNADCANHMPIRTAVARGNVTLTRWMLQQGASINPPPPPLAAFADTSILDTATDILGITPTTRSDDRFKNTVAFLRQECDAQWSSSSILKASTHRQWAPNVHPVLVWMADNGAPVDHPLLHPSFIRNLNAAVHARNAAKRRRLALRSANRTHESNRV